MESEVQYANRTLEESLRYHGDVDQTASQQSLLEAWESWEGEVRSATLLNLSWLSRNKEPQFGEEVAGMYAKEFHDYAKNFEGHTADFHGSRFPLMPLPGQAGALASSLGFDRDDVEISLKTALILLAPTLT